MISDLYQAAPAMAAERVHIHSCDEMTGIQALQHKHAALPMKPGKVERRAFEYIRHGTSGLIASRNVATGLIEAPLIQPTRTEKDFVTHIRNVVRQHPEDQHIFVTDQLNTHQSEALVLFVIEQCGLKLSSDAVGVKGKSGILKTMTSRKAFLQEESHPIRFVYTPKH
ncbi:transposase [Paenibacillus contaminans]|uniref:transposase n=1 Tax=Paenibacillus contaminans TaxID=450362 RepID=UPI00192D3AAE